MTPSACRLGGVLLMIAALAGPVEGQQEGADRPDLGAVLDSVAIAQQQRADGARLPEPPCQIEQLARIDSATALAVLAAVREQYGYHVTGFQHRARVFRWQLYFSTVIFVMVHVLVLAGLYFSWLQFRKGQMEGLESQFELSRAGLKVQSSVLGVIILVISLAFFYLYLVHVYRITETL